MQGKQQQGYAVAEIEGVILVKRKRSFRAGSIGLMAGCMATMATACGGGGSPSSPPPSGVTPTPAPTPTSAACSLRARQGWALAQLQEWYLFPELLNSSANPASYTNVDSYVDALVAPARAQSRDRYFTYLTSITEEDAYYGPGQTAGFGIRLAVQGTRLLVSEAFEGAPGLLAGMDRGTEITHIGATPSTMRSISDVIMTGGYAGLMDALGPDTPGTSRTFTINIPGVATRTVTVAKTSFLLDPVSDRYGAQIITDGLRQVGYVNLRTFIERAEPDLRAAFADFKAQGITEIIIDLRYNGGGLIRIADLIGDLMGAGRAGQVLSRTTFRPSKSQNNATRTFQALGEAIAPTKVAFIGTESTASASEMVINAFVPYLGANMALIGGNTYGKPVGQIAEDRDACDDRLRIVALRTENANGNGDYYTGLARTVPNTCRATDDLSHQLGDPQEEMVRVALDFLAGRSCAPIAASPDATASIDRVGTTAKIRPLTPEIPMDTIQRELPGAY